MAGFTHNCEYLQALEMVGCSAVISLLCLHRGLEGKTWDPENCSRDVWMGTPGGVDFNIPGTFWGAEVAHSFPVRLLALLLRWKMPQKILCMMQPISPPELLPLPLLDVRPITGPKSQYILALDMPGLIREE